MPAYSKTYAAQFPILEAAGQERLRQARVHAVGAGRIGAMLALNLAAAGVGYVSSNDPQQVEPDNLNSCVFLPADIGEEKVRVLEQRLESRQNFEFQPVPLPIEANEVDEYISAANLVVCCANTVVARVATEQKAFRWGKPSMQVAAFDGRDCLGGLIAVRLTENPWSACARCCIDPSQNWTISGALLSTVTSALAAIAANMAVAILSGVRTPVFRDKNVFYVDLETYGIEALAVQKSAECPLCGSVQQ